MLHAKHIPLITEESLERSAGVSLGIELSHRRASAEQLIKGAQKLCLPVAHHESKRVASYRAVSSLTCCNPPPLPSPRPHPRTTARGADTNAIISATTTAVARAVTSLWS